MKKKVERENIKYPEWQKNRNINLFARNTKNRKRQIEKESHVAKTQALKKIISH